MKQKDGFETLIFVETEVLQGLIFISTPEGRLLDELNSHSQLAPEDRDRFLMLTNVSIWYVGGTEENIAVVHINKENIEMAGTTNKDSGRGIGAKAGHKPYPFAEKVPFKVRIETPGYTIIGNMYRIGLQQIEHVLKERTAFIPLTDVEVGSTKSDKRWSLSFVAVNKSKILSLHEGV